MALVGSPAKLSKIASSPMVAGGERAQPLKGPRTS